MTTLRESRKSKRTEVATTSFLIRLFEQETDGKVEACKDDIPKAAVCYDMVVRYGLVLSSQHTKNKMGSKCSLRRETTRGAENQTTTKVRGILFGELDFFGITDEGTRPSETPPNMVVYV